MNKPILYSFRRCPYAIRARLALIYANIEYETREIVLKDKPQSLLAYSKKATVPILVLNEESWQRKSVIDESLDIMQWALFKDDPLNWLHQNHHFNREIFSLIEQCDNDFKGRLDKYKYAIRYPEQNPHQIKTNACEFVSYLETRLTHHDYLFGTHATLADYAIFPFIRQFAMVDSQWFNQAPYPSVQLWLHKLISNRLFTQAMVKMPIWREPSNNNLTHNY